MSDSDDLVDKAAKWAVSWLPGANEDVTVGKDSAGKIVGNVTANAVTSGVKGAVIGTAVAEGVTWGSIGTAAVLAQAGAGTAALSAIGVGAAIGNAIPIPGLGAAIGAIIGALVALGNAIKGPDFAYVARTPEEARTILSLIRVSPTFLPHLVATLVLEGKAQDPGALAASTQAFWQGKRDPVLVDLAQRMGGVKEGGGKAFDESDLYQLVKSLKLLAGEVPGVRFKGPVVTPSAARTGMPDAFARRWPDYDAWHESGGLPLKYLYALGPWDYQRTDLSMLPAPVAAMFSQPDPLLNPVYLKSLIAQWAEGRDVVPVVDADGARRVLDVLRKHLPASLAVAKDRSEAQHIDLSPLREEIKAVRRLAGEMGPDPVLGAIFGDVTPDPDFSGIALAGVAGLVLAGIGWAAWKSRAGTEHVDLEVELQRMLR